MTTFTTKKKILLISGALFLIALLAIAPNVLSSETKSDKKEASAPTPAANAVATDAYVIKSSTLEDKIETTGTLAANQVVDLVSEISKKVTGIFKNEGSHVTKGTLLFKLDDSDLQAKRKRLSYQEQLASLEEGRFRELLSREAVNQQDYDQASTALKVLQAEIEILDVEIAKTSLKAPFGGTIGLNRVDVGAYVTPATVLTTLQDVSVIEINFTIPEKYAAQITTGQKIQFTTETSNLPFDGKIIATEPGADVNTRSIVVKAISANRDGKLIPGSSAKISLSLNAAHDGIIIPTQALIPTPQGYGVFTVTHGVAAWHEVKTGSRTKSTIQVFEGLAAADTVLTTNLVRLAPGVPVKVVTVE